MTLPQIQGFDVIEPLSEGRVYTSYKARQRALDRYVVFTCFHESFSADEERFNAIIKDARRAARLKHPGILQVFDFGEEGGCRYLVTEYVEGTSLEQILVLKKSWPPLKALEVARAVAVALEYAWTRASIFHGALHPGKLWIDQGVVKIAGLGLTGLLAEERDESSITYLPPERAAREKPAMRDDVFALGMIIHDLVTGQLPPHGQPRSGAIISVTPPQGIPKEIWEIVRSMTSSDTPRCYTKWGDVLRDVERVLRNYKAEAEDVTEEQSAREPFSRKRIVKAPLLKITTPHRPSTGTQADPQGDARTPSAAPPIRPLVVTITWLIVVGLWGWLLWALIGRPPLPPPIAVRELPPPAVARAPAASPAPEAAGSSHASGTARTPVSTPSKNIRSPDYIQEMRRRLVVLEDDVVRFLVREEYAMALGAMDIVLEDSQDAQLNGAVRALRDFVGHVSALNEEVASALRLKSGSDVALSFKGRQVKGHLLSITGGQVDIEEIRDQGGAVVRIRQSLALSDLDAADREQWLGKDATPVHNAMRFILAERCRESAERARPLAAGSGPLAPAFMRWLDKAAGDEATPAPSEGSEGS